MELKIQNRRNVRLIAWLTMILVSLLPNIIFIEVFKLETVWLMWAKLIILGIFLLLGFLLPTWRELHHFFMILAGILLIDYGQSWLLKTDFWQNIFTFKIPFIGDMLGNQTTRFIAALVMIGLLLLLRYKPSEAYLVKGKLDAPVGRIRLLGFKDGQIKWSRFGWMSALAIGSGTLVFLTLGGTLQLSDVKYLPRVLPFIVLFAIMNAFYEEVFYRSAVISTLRNHLEKPDLIWLPAVFFGIGHFYGVPYGILGVVMATVLGWLLSKSMVETKGFFWPWFIHFVQDILIFSFMALGAVIPGG